MENSTFCIKKYFSCQKKWASFSRAFFYFLIFLLAVFSSFRINTANAADFWYNSSWSYRLKITVNAAQVPSTQTNFPVYVNLANLPAGFFSHVKSDGSDIRVTKSDGTTELAREVVSISTSGSTGEIWFKADSISSGSYFYIYYGNASATEPSASSTYGSQKVWDDGGSNYYKNVWHLPNGTTLTANDSTSNSINGTLQGSPPAISGKIDGGASFNGSSMDILKSSGGVSSNPMTISFWMNTSYSTDCVIFMTKNNFSDTHGIELWLQSGGLYVRGSGSTIAYTSTTFNTGQWVFATVVLNGTTAMMYKNGSAVTMAASTIEQVAVSADNAYLGRYGDGINGYYYSGYIDNFSISYTARSANWIATEYNNQSAPTTFYTVASEEGAWYNSSWGYRLKITVNAAQVPSAQTNFPVYVNLANLPAGFFSHVKSDGSDIRVTKSDGTTELAREVVAINTSGSTGEIWFKADSISNGSYFYIYYGNSSATEPAANATYGKNNVWDINFKGVYHLNDPANPVDSTSNGINGTNSGTTSTTGKIGNGANFVSASSQYIYGTGSNFQYEYSDTFSASCWIYANNLSNTNNYDCIGNWDVSAMGGWALSVMHNGDGYTNDVRVYLIPTSGWSSKGIGVYGASELGNQAWHLISFTYSGSGLASGIKIYVDGNPVTVTSFINNGFSGATIKGGHPFYMGRTGEYFNGKTDETRVSSSVRTADWIKTEYNNQNAPATFWGTGSEESNPIVISITLTSDGIVAYGNTALNSEKNTTASGLNDTQTVQNNGTVAEDFNIKSSDATGGTQWTVGASAGSNIFVHNFSTNSGSTWTSFDTTNSYKSLATNIAASATKSFDLKIHTPTATSDYQQKTITVTVQAVQH